MIKYTGHQKACVPDCRQTRARVFLVRGWTTARMGDLDLMLELPEPADNLALMKKCLHLVPICQRLFDVPSTQEKTMLLEAGTGRLNMWKPIDPARFIREFVRAEPVEALPFDRLGANGNHV